MYSTRTNGIHVDGTKTRFRLSEAHANGFCVVRHIHWFIFCFCSSPPSVRELAVLSEWIYVYVFAVCVWPFLRAALRHSTPFVVHTGHTHKQRWARKYRTDIGKDRHTVTPVVLLVRLWNTIREFVRAERRANDSANILLVHAVMHHMHDDVYAGGTYSANNRASTERKRKRVCYTTLQILPFSCTHTHTHSGWKGTRRMLPFVFFLQPFFHVSLFLFLLQFFFLCSSLLMVWKSCRRVWRLVACRWQPAALKANGQYKQLQCELH